ncbi:hypothetical protein [Kitasatospora sp. NPDC086791]|uniref:hypothetical protein n=1 Tax=Kitasatospora sp. NPDC086791 TaxID=3155178 RepID=UPI00342E4C7F
MIDAAAEFRFLFPGTARAVIKALDTVQRGASGRIGIPFGEVVSERPEDVRAAVAEFNRVAGDVLGRVATGSYDVRKFRTRDAVRCLSSAMESAAMGDLAEAVKATHKTFNAVSAARRR